MKFESKNTLTHTLLKGAWHDLPYKKYSKDNKGKKLRAKVSEVINFEVHLSFKHSTLDFNNNATLSW